METASNESMVTYYLALSASLFELTVNELSETFQLDRETLLHKPVLDEDFLGVDHIDRFLHDLLHLIFNIYCTLLSNVYSVGFFPLVMMCN
jgi:hypothetical protein